MLSPGLTSLRPRRIPCTSVQVKNCQATKLHPACSNAVRGQVPENAGDCRGCRGLGRLTENSLGSKIRTLRALGVSMSGLTRRAVALAFSLAIGLPVALAQDAQDSGDAPTAKKIEKTTKRKMKQTLKELDNAYKQWLQEDVVYIITPDERNAFLQLQTNEEREQFIEQFWLRRSSNPDLPDNDFKEEHYRRIAYANEHYASGIPGWKTDRGRMYIMWGPADEVESHPTGGTYDRPMEEGGGTTSTYPWEKWRYRYLQDRKSTRLNSSH